MTLEAAKRRVVRLLPGLRPLVLARKGLTDIGWVRSGKEGLAVDRLGNPLPWITYPAIHLLTEFVPSDATVFEYGGGQSTLWWSSRVDRVTCCESDRGWAEFIASSAPENVAVIQLPVGDRYVDAIREAAPVDIAVVDGRERVACALAASTALTERGVIVWDNSGRPTYLSGIRSLVDAGFRHLPLQGLFPGGENVDTTSIFYRDGNILGL